MEEVYPRPGSKTNQPEVYCTEHGSGRVVFFPFDIDRTFFEVMAVDHLRLLRNAVGWAANEEPVLRVTGPGVLDTTVFRQKKSFTIHLVNLTNPMFARGPIRDIYPVGPLQVQFRVPEPYAVNSVRLLTAGTKPAYSFRSRTVEVVVPSVAIHEVIAVDVA
jgi:hypothetical protein